MGQMGGGGGAASGQIGNGKGRNGAETRFSARIHSWVMRLHQSPACHHAMPGFRLRAPFHMREITCVDVAHRDSRTPASAPSRACVCISQTRKSGTRRRRTRARTGGV